MKIQDDTLRALFKAESDEHLQKLDEALLHLERAPGDTAMLEEAFREAHSMKGAARMLGLPAIQSLAHTLEDRLNSARRGDTPLDGSAISALLRGVQDIRERVGESVGDSSTAPAASTVTVTAPAPHAATAPVVPQATADVEGGHPAGRQAGRESAPMARETTQPVESVRIDTRRLDELMTHAGELLVTRTRISRRLAEIDGVLSLVDVAARKLPAAARPALAGIQDALARLRGAHAEDTSRFDALSLALDESVRRMRLLPLSNVFRPFARMVRELANEQEKDIELQILGDDTQVDKRILDGIKDPLMHMLRNAVDHGIELPAERVAAGKPHRGTVSISVHQEPDGVRIVVSDDGRGLDLEAIRAVALQRGIASQESLAAMTTAQVHALVLAPGFSTARMVTDVSGRGVGLDVVRNNVERLEGTLTLESEHGRGTQISIHLPKALATSRVLLTKCGGQSFGFPVNAVVECRRLAATDTFALQGRRVALHRGRAVPVAALSELLGLGGDAGTGGEACVFFEEGEACVGAIVDAVVDVQEVVLKPACSLMVPVRNVAGAAILASGEICVILDPFELARSLPVRTAPARPATAPAGAQQKRKVVLLAEDSITTRTQEIRILEGAGYEVVAATDGADAFGKLGSRHFDALVSDVQMPRMDGLQLAERVRALPQYAELPIILVTSLSSNEDKRRGLEVGANAYITKGDFDQGVLLDCLRRLVG